MSDEAMVERKGFGGAFAGRQLKPQDWVSDLTTAIEESRWILSLESDWDDNGAEAISLDTWKRATGFLERHVRWLRRRLGTKIPLPRILPVPDGSIDLHWDTSDFEVLVNVPRSSTEPAEFYGDDRGKNVVKGSFDPTDGGESA